jgi:hypothetical protein
MISPVGDTFSRIREDEFGALGGGALAGVGDVHFGAGEGGCAGGTDDFEVRAVHVYFTRS